MLEKIKQRLEKGKQVRAEKNSAKEEQRKAQSLDNYLYDMYNFAYKESNDYFYKYVTLLEMSGKDFLCFTESMELSFKRYRYIMKVDDKYVMKVQEAHINEDGTESRYESFYYFMDEHCIVHCVSRSIDGTLYRHIELGGYKFDKKTGKSEENYTSGKREYAQVKTNNTEKELGIIKFVDSIIVPAEETFNANETARATTKTL